MVKRMLDATPSDFRAMTDDDLDQPIRLAEAVHREGSLVWMVLDHGIEGAQREAIIQFALNASMAGADVLEIGDSGLGGIAWPENVMELSMAIRGRRHTLRRMAMSLNR